MSWFGHLRVQLKVMVAVGVVALLTLGLGVIAVLSLQSVNNATLEITTNWLPSVKVVEDLNTNTSDYRLAQYRHTTSTTPETLKVAEDQLAAQADVIAKNRAIYERLISSPHEQDLYQTFSDQWGRYLTLSDPIIALSSRSQKVQAVALLQGDALTVYDQASATLLQLVDLNAKGGQDASQAAASTYGTARTAIVAAIVIAVGLGLTLAFLVGRMIAAPLRRAVTVLQGLAAGRLDQRLDVATRDEVGAMAIALNTAMDTLATTMTAIGENSGTLAAACEELSATSSEMMVSSEESAAQAGSVAASAGEVSSNVQTVAAGSEQMGASIAEIANNAQQAARVADSAVDVVNQTDVMMRALETSSTQIGEVINMITGIAEQTNLLALNATIEAARAGDAGKGFAVVASEVKELAQETARATGQISDQVTTIQRDTAAAAGAMTQIRSIITQINDFQTTIAGAVEEQTATTAEMNRSVSEAATGSAQIAESVAMVATAVTQTSSSAGSTQQATAELATMASELQRLVGQFRY